MHQPAAAPTAQRCLASPASYEPDSKRELPPHLLQHSAMRRRCRLHNDQPVLLGALPLPSMPARDVPQSAVVAGSPPPRHDVNTMPNGLCTAYQVHMPTRRSGSQQLKGKGHQCGGLLSSMLGPAHAARCCLQRGQPQACACPTRRPSVQELMVKTVGRQPSNCLACGADLKGRQATRQSQRQRAETARQATSSAPGA